MGRPWQAVSVLAALARNGNLRRVELAWGASIAAGGTHLRALLGPLVAGVLVSVANAGVVFLVASGALLAAAGLLQRVVVEGRLQATAAAAMPRARELLAGGFRAVVSTPRTRLLVFLTTAQSFIRGCLNVLIVIGAFRLLGAGGRAARPPPAPAGGGGPPRRARAAPPQGRRACGARRRVLHLSWP